MYSNAGGVNLTKTYEPFLKNPPLPSPRKLAGYKMILLKKDAISLKYVPLCMIRVRILNFWLALRLSAGASNLGCSSEAASLSGDYLVKYLQYCRSQLQLLVLLLRPLLLDLFAPDLLFGRVKHRPVRYRVHTKQKLLLI